MLYSWLHGKQKEKVRDWPVGTSPVPVLHRLGLLTPAHGYRAHREPPPSPGMRTASFLKNEVKVDKSHTHRVGGVRRNLYSRWVRLLTPKTVLLGEEWGNTRIPLLEDAVERANRNS